MEELLPIGSVVEVYDLGLLMIIGYLPNTPKDNELTDYICCKKNVGIRKERKDLFLNKDYFYINKNEIKKNLVVW